MPKLTVTVSDTITYSDSEGRKYKGPLKDAPSYVIESVEEMNKMMQSLDDTCSSLLNRTIPGSADMRSYKMTIGKAFDWIHYVIIGAGLLGLVALAILLRSCQGR